MFAVGAEERKREREGGLFRRSVLNVFSDGWLLSAVLGEPRSVWSADGRIVFGGLFIKISMCVRGRAMNMDMGYRVLCRE